MNNDRSRSRARSRRRVLAAGLVLLSLVLVGISFTPAARAAGDDFVFTGRGWGHGTGMSQWGAWQAAVQDAADEGRASLGAALLEAHGVEVDPLDWLAGVAR